jgi:RNA polymerase sigma factor (sigma-70 family)
MSPRELDEAIVSHEGLVCYFLIKHHINKKDIRFYDMAQEMRLVVWHALETFDPERGIPFGLYATVCMWRRFVRLNTKKKKRLEDNEIIISLDVENDEDDLIDTIADEYRYEDVSDARLIIESVFASSEALTRPRAFKALRLVAEGRTCEEASIMLDCSRQNVNLLVHTARRRVLEAATASIACERG